MSYKTISEYIEDQPVESRQALFQLRSIILEAAPGATELFNYGVPAFALIEGGKRDQQVMMAGYKNHVGFYPHPTTMETFSEQLHEYKQGKGSVQFPLNRPLPKELIIKMVRYRKDILNQ